MTTKETGHATRAHAVLGGSSASRWTNCTGSLLLSRDVPPRPSSPAADEGTKAHEMAQVVLEDFLLHKLNGTDPEVRFNTLPKDDDLMLEYVKEYRDAVWTNGLDQHITGKAFGLEEKFILDEKLDMWGTVDFWAVYISDRGKRVGYICDFKYGYHFVPADRNAQLAFYATAMREEFRRAGKDLDIIRAAIFQPRGSEPVYREAEFTSKELGTWKKKFYNAAHHIFIAKKPKFKVGDWCEFCPARPVCKTYAKEIGKRAAIALIEPEADLSRFPAPETLSDEFLNKVILHGDAICSYVNSCKSYGINRALAGNPVEGTKLIQGPTRRTWEEDEEEIIRKLKHLGVEDCTKCKLKGITVVEKELKRIHTDKTAKEIRDSLESMVTETVPSLMLVSNKDERETIKSQMEMLNDE